MHTLPRILIVVALWLLVHSTVPAAAPPPQGPDPEKWEALLKTHPDDPALLAALVPGAYLPAAGDPQRRLSFRVWARGRLEALLANSSASERKALEAALARQWRTAKAWNAIAAMRAVIALVGVEHPLGQEARWYLASRLAADGYSPAADQLLQELRRGPNAQGAAKAVLALAEMMERAGLLRDALAYYHILGRDYARVQVVPGKTDAGNTGADVLANLATDKRFLPFMEERRPIVKGRPALQYREERESTREQEGFTFTPLDKAPPFFQQHGLTVVANELRMWDRETGGEELRLQVPTTGFGTIAYNFTLNHQVRIGSQSVGHMTLLNLGAQVVAVDPLGRKLLWHRDVLELGNTVPDRWAVDNLNDDDAFPPRKPRRLQPPLPPVDYRKDDTARVEFGKGGALRLGGRAPLTPTRLCLATKRGLFALDPLTGEVCWSRTDVPQDCRLFDDGVHVFVVQFKPDGKVARTAAYRLADGAPVRIKDFAALYEKRLSIVDGRLLVWEEAAGKAVVLRLYDVITGKDDWQQVCPARTIPTRSEDPALTGVVEPKGNVRVWEARTKKPVVSLNLPNPESAGKVKAYRLVGDADNLYLASERPRSEDVLSDPKSLFLPWAGLRAIPVNGFLYAFRRDTGQLIWFNEARNQMLLVSEIERLPMLLLAVRYEGLVGKPPAQTSVSVSDARAFAKHNGKLWYKNGSMSATMYFHAIRVDQTTGKVELLGRGMKVSMTAVPR
jgi:hypothetical protein